MDDACKNNEENSSNKNCKILIVFDNKLVDKLSNKNVIQQKLNYLSEIEH